MHDAAGLGLKHRNSRMRPAGTFQRGAEVATDNVFNGDDLQVVNMLRVSRPDRLDLSRTGHAEASSQRIDHSEQRYLDLRANFVPLFEELIYYVRAKEARRAGNLRKCDVRDQLTAKRRSKLYCTCQNAFIGAGHGQVSITVSESRQSLLYSFKGRICKLHGHRFHSPLRMQFMGNDR